MPENDNGNGNGSAEIKTPIFSASFRGKDMQLRDMVMITVLAVTSLTAYAMFEHKNERRQADLALSTAIKELTAASRANAVAQREMNCLISLPQDRREADFNSPNGLCKRVTRDGF